jgi:GNAT superfamily N-acetyltransferase
VWKAEGFSVSPCPDEHALHARHWIVTRNRDIVGAARLCFHNSIQETPDFEDIEDLGLSVFHHFGFLSRLVVCPSARGHKLSGYLDAVRVEAARAIGAKFVLGRFYDYREKGLAALGFRQIGKFHDPKFGNRLVLIMQLDLRDNQNERE